MDIVITLRTGEIKKITHSESDTILRASDFEAFNKDMIKEVNIAEGICTLFDETFESFRFLKKITLPKTMRIIGVRTFKDCESLEEINIPNGVYGIGKEAFFGCEKLQKIDLSKCTVAQLYEGVFNGCKNLREVSLPDGLMTICEGAFCGCYKLKSIKIPNTVFAIRECAFLDCEELSEFNLPQNTSLVGKDAFHNTQYYNDDANYVDGLLWKDNVLLKGKGNLHYDKPVLTISGKDFIVFADECFMDNKSIETVIIECPDVQIGSRAFAFTNVTSLLVNTQLGFKPNDWGFVIIQEEAFKTSNLDKVQIYSDSFCLFEDGFNAIRLSEVNIRTNNFTLEKNAISNIHIDNLILEDNMEMVHLYDEYAQNTTLNAVTIVRKNKDSKDVVIETNEDIYNVPDTDFLFELLTSLSKPIE